MLRAQLSKILGGQEKLILPLDISISPPALASGRWKKRGMQPWARSVLARSERVSGGYSADSAGSVDVAGVAAHSVWMMGAGVRRQS